MASFCMSELENQKRLREKDLPKTLRVQTGKLSLGERRKLLQDTQSHAESPSRVRSNWFLAQPVKCRSRSLVGGFTAQKARRTQRLPTMKPGADIHGSFTDHFLSAYYVPGPYSRLWGQDSG